MSRPRRICIALLIALGACDDEAAGGPALDDTTDGAAGDAESDGGLDTVGDPPPGDASDDSADVALDESDAPPLEVTCLEPTGADPAGTESLTDPLGVASVTVDGRDACQRTYQLSSTAVRRDNLPASPRTIVEEAGWPTLRSGNDLFDALYALALLEVRQNQVDEVGGVDCGEGGCFITGELWLSVWTRDTAFAADLGLATVAPLRARNSLLFKLSERRGGGGLQIVQDTGTGGSYPVSSDRVVWALGADAVLLELQGEDYSAFAAQTATALHNTIEHDRTVVFDAESGLYFGEQSFLDWREQSYPSWTAQDPTYVAWSRSLSTNLLHLAALDLAIRLATEQGDEVRALRYDGWAEALRQAIRDRFWLEEEGLFSTFLPSPFDPAPVRRYDLLGSALAILSDVATPEQADRVLASYPHWGRAAPVIWPQQQLTRIYHNRAEWPFVDAYWLRAAQQADNAAVAARMVDALVRGAGLNLSNMENFEAGSGAPWLDDGGYSGPVVNSRRQLWSVAGYLSMVQHTLFGLEPRPEGLRVVPYLPAGLRATMFAGTNELVLNDYPFRGRRVSVVLHLPESGGEGGSYVVASRQLNGLTLDGEVAPVEELAAANRIDVWLEPNAQAEAAAVTVVTDEDWRDVFGPRTPRIDELTAVDGDIQLTIVLAGDDPADVVLHVYRDGERVAQDLPGTTTTWIDVASDAAGAESPCYTVEASFTGSGNHSQHARAVCWWGAAGEHITSVPATEFDATGGEGVENHGRFHYQNWGDAGHVLEMDVTAVRSGEHWLQVQYGNGSGPINTGITCAVKSIRVEDATGAIAGEGFLVMPQLGSWARWEASTVVPVELEAGETYHIVIQENPAAVNMSFFEHFADYTGGTGGSAPFNRVNISELLVLER